MARIEKTVFISYRRTNASWALAVFQNLTRHGYDAFYDFNGIASGDFERVIIENINARAHFLVLLTPSALERCSDPGDWLRREIETALNSQRNIVPLMLEGFDYSSPAIAKHLTGELSKLARYNALRVPIEYFDEAMGRLREKYLNISLDTVLHPASSTAQQNAKAQQSAANNALQVQVNALTAEQWFERGYYATNSDESLRCYSEAIRSNPAFADAYNYRGAARRDKGDLDGALKDFDEAIRLNPDFADAPFPRRGIARGRWRSDFEELPAARKQTWLHKNRTLAGVGIGVLLAIVILVGTVLYSQQSGSLAALGVNIEDIVGVGSRNPSQIQAPDNITQDKKRATSMAP